MANTYLTMTQPSGGSRRKWTWSAWIKKSAIGVNQAICVAYQDSANSTVINFESDDEFNFYEYQGASVVAQKHISMKAKDVNGWYHFMCIWDSENSTADDRMIIYVNGIRQTAFQASTNPSINTSTAMNRNGYPVRIGAFNSNNYFNGSMSHVNFCGGTVLAPTVFGETDATTGEWKIKADATFTPGIGGYSILKDGNTITDQSSNSNNFSLGGGTLTKTEDNPDNVFATMNSLDKNTNVVLTNGNTTSYSSANNTWVAANRATLGIAKDKFYWEMKITGSGTANGLFFGVCADTVALITSQGIQDNATEKAKGVLVFCDNGQYQLDTNSRVNMTSAPAFNDILGCAVDRDNNTVKFYKNGSQVGSIDISSSPLATCSHIMPFMINFYTNTKFNFNFGNGYFGSTQISSAGTNASGNGIFEYDTPTGYTALSTKGLNL